MLVANRRLLAGLIVSSFIACSSSKPGDPSLSGGDGGAPDGGAGADGGVPGDGGGQIIVGNDGGGRCVPDTCAKRGWQCGSIVSCGQIVHCADEGLTCDAGEVCVGGKDAPAECKAGGVECEVCGALPTCSGSKKTKLKGRVVTAGRQDANDGNQVGVPNAVVYILRSADVADLPAINAGVPSDGISCDRCEDQDLGPVLVGAVTDAAGRYELEGNIPVDKDFLLVVKAGKFRRAVKHKLPASAACETTTLSSALPANPTRLPRAMDDGLAVNIPRIAISTGEIDAMECVFEKMGLAHDEFGNPGADGNATPRVHLYRGGANSGSPPGTGAYLDANTPHNSKLYGDLGRIHLYDMVVSDCEGGSYDSGGAERTASGQNIVQYVNRGGRLFASHLSFTWLYQNGSQAYSEADPFHTGLNAAATWDTNTDGSSSSAVCSISLDRPAASPRIESFASWMDSEGIASAPDHDFNITQPRSQCTGLGDDSEEFVYRTDGNQRVQQFSFNAPYGAPEAAACGRVAYSGFHVVAAGGSRPYEASVFPNHCSGDLSDQEKVLLYMLFDLGACVGAPPIAPACVPDRCGDSCGYISDGCGDVLDCGDCPLE